MSLLPAIPLDSMTAGRLYDTLVSMYEMAIGVARGECDVDDPHVYNEAGERLDNPCRRDREDAGLGFPNRIDDNIALAF